ncbi:MAG: hypothetical protein Q9185_003420 [Variospora sp. 1 TL-2023]
MTNVYERPLTIIHHTISSNGQDHFYICPGHLKDKGFCSPIVDEAEVAAKKKKEELDREIELIKKEYEERLKKRKKSKDSKQKEKDKKKTEDDKSGENKTDNVDDEAEKEKNDKVRHTSASETLQD